MPLRRKVDAFGVQNNERRINGPDGRFPKSKAEKTKKKKPASVNLGGGGDKVW
jgi:hypothetical protein